MCNLLGKVFLNLVKTGLVMYFVAYKKANKLNYSNNALYLARKKMSF